MKQKTNSQTPAVINFDYEGNPISFTMDGVVMANATEMAKPFGKLPNEWLRLPSTDEFLRVLETTRKSGSLTEETTGKSRSLVRTIEGRNGGTWMHEDVALEFSRWLSPKFSIWCNDRIKELLTKGHVSITGNQQLLWPANDNLEKRVSDLETCITHMYSEIEYYKQRTRDISTELTKINENLYNTDEYSEIYTGLNNRVLELNEIIEDKERIIKLQSRQLEAERADNKRVKEELERLQSNLS